MTLAVLSIGSNVGDRLANLRTVTDALGSRLRARSPVYVTAPWGVTDQADFYNAVLLAEDGSWDEWEWLEFAQRCERAAQRTRERHWGPRTLDVDIINCAKDGEPVVQRDPRLTLPHPHAHERAFVLVPWLDVDPHAALHGTPIAELLTVLSATEREGVQRRPDQTEWLR